MKIAVHEQTHNEVHVCEVLLNMLGVSLVNSVSTAAADRDINQGSICQDDPSPTIQTMATCRSAGIEIAHTHTHNKCIHFNPTINCDTHVVN